MEDKYPVRLDAHDVVSALVGSVGIILMIFALFALVGCGSDAPLAATPSPSPSATPVPITDAASCVQAALSVYGINGAGNPDSLFDYREPIEVRAVPINAAGVPLAQVQRPAGDRCTFPAKAGWEHGGPCMPFGSLDGLTGTYFCFDSGELTIAVTHGNHVGRARLKLIR